MSIDDIRTLKHTKPFRPFELVTTGGQRVLIKEPICIALSPTGDSVAGYSPSGSFFLMLAEIAEVRQKKARGRKAA
jgi:hypothetical protein